MSGTAEPSAEVPDTVQLNVAPQPNVDRRLGPLWVLRGIGGCAFMLGQVAGAAWATSWLLGADATSSHWLRQHRPETAVFVLLFALIYAWSYWHEESR